MKKLFSYAAAVLFFSAMAVSCTKDAPEPGGDIDGGDGGDGIEAFFSFAMSAPNTLSGPSAKTRAAADTDEGTLEEQRVQDVTILLYDQTGKDATLRYVFNLDAYNSDDGTVTEPFDGNDVVNGSTPSNNGISNQNSAAASPTSDQFVSVGRKVKYQDYQMVVLINTNALISNPVRAAGDWPSDIQGKMIVGESKLSDIETLYGRGLASFMQRSDMFFMSNANGPVQVRKEWLADNKVEAEKEPVKVNVDRIVAKVMIFTNFEENSDYTSFEAGTGDESVTHWKTSDGREIGDVEAVLNKTNRHANIIRQFANLADGTPETYLNGNVHMTQSDRLHVYAKDHNFGVGNGSMIGASAAVLAENFDTLEDNTQVGAGFLGKLTEFSTADLMDYVHFSEYVLENTMELTEQAHAEYMNYTTHALIRATIAPKGFAYGESYYSYINNEGKPKVFTHSDALGYLDSYDAAYWTNYYKIYEERFESNGNDSADATDYAETEAPVLTEAQVFNSIEMTGLYAILKKINDYNAANSGNEYPMDFRYGSSYPKLDDGYGGERTYVILSDLFTVEGITIHPQGLNLYRVPIKHFQPTTPGQTAEQLRATLYGYFGVVRNNLYRMKINSISGPGTGDGLDWISADIVINPWFVRDWEEEL